MAAHLVMPAAAPHAVTPPAAPHAASSAAPAPPNTAQPTSDAAFGLPAGQIAFGAMAMTGAAAFLGAAPAYHAVRRSVLVRTRAVRAMSVGPQRLSQRADVVRAIEDMLATMDATHYAVVTGGKGAGASFARSAASSPRRRNLTHLAHALSMHEPHATPAPNVHLQASRPPSRRTCRRGAACSLLRWRPARPRRRSTSRR